MATPNRLKVVISGASGMIGQALTKALSIPSAINHFNPHIYKLVRRNPQSDDEIFWDPREMKVDIKKLEDVDAIVHLAGENVGSGDGLLAFTGRWTPRKKHLIMESRRRGTQLLSQAIAALHKKPKVFVTASGVGYYGNQGSALLTEATGKGLGFLSDVADVWESSSAAASDAGVRTVNLRLGVVLGPEGALAKMYWPTYCGLSGPIGSGEQYVSWVSLEDAVRGIIHAISRRDLSGPVNLCSPNPVQQRDFIASFARAMSRPAVIPMPEAAVRLVFGEMGEETLLVSQRAVPEKLLASNFRFHHENIDDAMRAAVAAF